MYAGIKTHREILLALPAVSYNRVALTGIAIAARNMQAVPGRSADCILLRVI